MCELLFIEVTIYINNGEIITIVLLEKNEL